MTNKGEKEQNKHKKGDRCSDRSDSDREVIASISTLG